MIVVDVGANKGELSSFLLAHTNNLHVFAFEPNSTTCSESLNLISELYPSNFSYIPKAVSRTNGSAKLFAPQVMEGQIASLLEINTRGAWQKEVADKLIGEKTIQFTEVETCTVELFAKNFGVHNIDFIKIDTQGTDLDILEDFLRCCDLKVAAIEIEINSDMELSHYLESKNDIHRLMTLLDFYQYKIIRMMPASADCREFNVFISKSLEYYNEVDSVLNFSSMPVFSRFWEVLGIGDKNTDIYKLQKSIFLKVISAVSHPLQSYRSVLIKLSS
jgi:FkbM family methyltransferase